SIATRHAISHATAVRLTMERGCAGIFCRNAPTNGETRNQPAAKGNAVMMICGIAANPDASPCELRPKATKTKKQSRSPITSIITARLYGISLEGLTFFSVTGTFLSSVADTILTPLGVIIQVDYFIWLVETPLRADESAVSTINRLLLMTWRVYNDHIIRFVFPAARVPVALQLQVQCARLVCAASARLKRRTSQSKRPRR